MWHHDWWWPQRKEEKIKKNLDIMECRRPHVPVHPVHTVFYIYTPAFKWSFLDQFEEPQMLVKCQRVELEKRQVDPCKEAQKKNWVESKCLERKPLPTKRRLSGNVHSCINWMYSLASRSHYIHALIHLSICSLILFILHHTLYLGYFNLTLSVLVACWHTTKFKEIE